MAYLQNHTVPPYQQTAALPNRYLTNGTQPQPLNYSTAPTRSDSSNGYSSTTILPITPSNANITDIGDLIWHLTHLANITTSTLQTYLSLESLTRNLPTLTTTHPPPPFTYHPALRATAHLLADMATNLTHTHAHLLSHPLHTHYLQTEPAYRSLITATTRVPEIVALVPQNSAPFLEDAAKLVEACLPSTEVVAWLRSGMDELGELCEGKAGGVVGWNECWRRLNPHG